MTKRNVTTQAELLSDLTEEFQSLDRLLKGIADSEMVDNQDSQGWTVKDHVAHLTGWARLALLFFQGTPPHVALGVDQAMYLQGSAHDNYDLINEVLRQQTLEASANQVVEDFRRTHQDLVRLLEKLSDEELRKPYRHYLPQDSEEWGDTPAINVAYGNSAHHYREHREWIQALTTSSWGGE